MALEVPEVTAREGAKNIIDANAKDSVLMRALILILIDEFNILRAKHGLPSRTIEQLKTAIKSRIDNGDAD